MYFELFPSTPRLDPKVFNEPREMYAMTRVGELENNVKTLIGQLNLYKQKKYTETDISVIQDKLHEIDEQWSDGAVKEVDGSIAPGQAELGELLNDAHELVADLLGDLE
jgi:hypothetical protein